MARLIQINEPERKRSVFNWINRIRAGSFKIVASKVATFIEVCGIS